MSTASVEREVLRFLGTRNAEVLSVRGKWGVGKTFSWKKYLNQAVATKKLGLSKYAYVSLFGVGSLNELKYSIFEHTVSGTHIGTGPTFETFNEFVTSVEGLGRRQSWLLRSASQFLRISDGLVPALFLGVKEQLVCLDDLERKGDGLSVGDILGLCTFLKEQRNCKVVILLNDEALKEGEKEEFEGYLEKVVDVVLRFAPNPDEATKIALPTLPEQLAPLAGYCRALGLTNIRLMQRIARSARQLCDLLQEFDAEVLKQALQTVSLLTWCVFDPEGAPSIEYLCSRRPHFGKEEEVSEKEAAWGALLDAFGFSEMDEFDLEILTGVRNGFFEPSALKERALASQAQYRATKADGSFAAAWRLYHDSFDANEDEIADAVEKSFRATLGQRTLGDLSATVALLKDLGRATQAAALLEEYLEFPGRTREAFDLNEYGFPEFVRDPDVIEACRVKYASFAPGSKDGPLVLQTIAERGGWNEEDLTTLSKMTVHQFVELFHGARGESLRKMISMCLGFSTFGNASDEMKVISGLARDALRTIGSESPLNARRVGKFGVSTDDRPTPHDAD